MNNPIGHVYEGVVEIDADGDPITRLPLRGDITYLIASPSYSAPRMGDRVKYRVIGGNDTEDPVEFVGRVVAKIGAKRDLREAVAV